jgi:AcrR family transcriptional regulator
MPRPRLQDARDRLLEAGLELLARDGLSGVNTNAIARRAGVGVGTFYGHFTDKHALHRALQLQTLAELQEARRRAVARLGPGADPVTEVDGAVRAAVHFARDRPDAYRITFGREHRGPARVRSRPAVSESSRPTADRLRRMQAGGDLDPDIDVDLAARAYAAMEAGLLLWWLEAPERAIAEDLVATLVRMHPIVTCRA